MDTLKYPLRPLETFGQRGREWDSSTAKEHINKKSSEKSVIEPFEPQEERGFRYAPLLLPIIISELEPQVSSQSRAPLAFH